MFDRMEQCVTCVGTGYRCSEGHENWQGAVFIADDCSGRVFEWIKANMWTSPEELKSGDIPFRTNDELNYLAFSVDLMGAQVFPRTNDDLRAIRWMKRCRDLAVEAGGEPPRVMRLS